MAMMVINVIITALRYAYVFFVVENLLSGINPSDSLP
jgi:hypothetical protein